MRDVGSKFAIQFTRYNSTEGRRTITPARSVEVVAESFDEVHDIAGDMLRGMRMADPESKFEIARIEVTSYTVEENRPENTLVRDPFNVLRVNMEAE